MKPIKHPQQYKVFFLWLSLALFAVLFFQFYEHSRRDKVKNFNYPKFLQAVEDNQLIKNSIVFNETSKEIFGKLNAEGKSVYGGTEFLIEGNVNDKGFEILKNKGIIPSYKNKDKNFWTSVFLAWLPILLIFGFFMFMIRQFQAGSGKAFSFGKSRARLVLNKGGITFKDVAGIHEAKEELKEIVAFLKNPKRFTKLGGEIPKGVLLIGDPGTGKTLLAKAVAGEAKVPFFTISGSDFVEVFVGVGASRVRDLFLQGKQNSPCLIFIDEIDAVGRQRGAGLGGGHDEREQTLNQLLVEMDGFESKTGIILIAATNRPDVLDPALLRPGRFDRKVMIQLPVLKERELILKVHTKKTPLAKTVQLSKIARGTPGLSGADLKNLVNEACLMAAFKSKTQIDMEDLERAKDKVIMGSERRSFVMSDKEKEITAYHEAGHAIVCKSLPLMDPIHKITIIPRGMSLGATHTLPKEESVHISKQKATNLLSFLFGGRVAEEIIFKDYTSGASNDIQKATNLARQMVNEWGMSTAVGPIAFGKNKDNPVFLGKAYNQDTYGHSEDSAKKLDAEVHNLIQQAYKRATSIIKEKINILHVMTKALLQFETIDAHEVQMIMQDKTLLDIQKYRNQKKESLKNNQQKTTKSSKQKQVSGSALPNPV